MPPPPQFFLCLLIFIFSSLLISSFFLFLLQFPLSSFSLFQGEKKMCYFQFRIHLLHIWWVSVCVLTVVFRVVLTAWLQGQGRAGQSLMGNGYQGKMMASLSAPLSVIHTVPSDSLSSLQFLKRPVTPECASSPVHSQYSVLSAHLQFLLFICILFMPPLMAPLSSCNHTHTQPLTEFI